MFLCVAHIGLFLAFMALPASLAAAEFSGELLLLDDGQRRSGKIYVKDGNLRQEFVDEHGHTVTIVRREQRRIWILWPRKQVYLELPLQAKLPGQFLQIPPESLQKRKVGQEQVNGYDTEKYECLVPGGSSGPLRQYYWLSPKLGLPLKMTCAEKQLTIEYRHIREGPVADRLFAIPPGFRKSDAGLQVEVE